MDTFNALIVIGLCPVATTKGTGLKEVSSRVNLSVYPVPFSSEFILSGTIENAEVILYDMNGKEMIRQNTNNIETKINTTLLIPGIYFLNYKAGDNILHMKLVKF
jgi:hypothetical protein